MSSTSNSGCSNAAKWPPRGISVHRSTLKNRSAHSRGGFERSLGNIAKAVGTSDEPSRCLMPCLIQVLAPAWVLSKYGANEWSIVSVTQYRVTLASNSSLVKHRSTSPSQSLHL